MNNVTIIGAGLVGTLLAIYLAKRGYAIELFEARSDIRLEHADQGRSINLALSCRGITGLEGVDLMPLVTKIMVPMRARAIHEEQGTVKYQAFGRHCDEYINAISRSDLNRLLLSQLETQPNVHVYFNMSLVKLDVHQRVLQFKQPDGAVITKTYERLMGADGAGSFVRHTLQQEQLISASRSFLPHGYKELSIGRETCQLAREHLHLWPRDSFLLLGNPNPDDSITGSLFLAHEGKNSFAQLDNELSIKSFFKNAFPDAYLAMPNVVNEFLTHPTGNMSTVKASPWYYQDSCLLIGDAAHGVVPFFGQGMNCGFEDCRLLNELLSHFDDDWQQVMPSFYDARKANTDAVAAMSMDNYHEIQIDIRNERFNVKKQLEQALMHHYPERYVSKHVLVMFTNTPYAQAKMIGMLQNDLLNNIFLLTRRVSELNWPEVDVLMEKYDKKLTQLAHLTKYYE